MSDVTQILNDIKKVDVSHFSSGSTGMIRRRAAVFIGMRSEFWTLVLWKRRASITSC